MQRIKVNGKFPGYVLIDDEDFERVSQYNWSCSNNKTISARVNGKTTNIGRFIMPSDFECIDHIDGNIWNNQKSNLRPCSSAQNIWNRKIEYKPYYNIKRGYYTSYLQTTSGVLFLGNFLTKDEAIAAYNKKRAELCSNFIRQEIKKVS